MIAPEQETPAVPAWNIDHSRRFVRPPDRTLLVFAVLALGACSSPLEDAELPPYSPPGPACPARVTAESPVVALEWRGQRETYLPAGSTTLAFDYSVVPRAHVDRVRLTYNFDPGQTMVAPHELSSECPSDVPLADLLAPILTDDIVAMTVTASSSSGGGERRGRVFVARGGDTREVSIAGLDLGESADGDWYLVFEPAAGSPRLSIARVGAGEVATIEGIPDSPGTFALIQTPVLRVGAGEAIDAPLGFARTWRRRARAWYSSTVVSSDVPVLLRAIVPPRASVGYRVTRERERLTASEPAVLLEAPASGASTVLEVPCNVTSLLLQSTGFVTAEVDASVGTLEMGHGEALATPIECASGADSVEYTLRITNLGGIPAPVLVTLGGWS
jgi:hypothetical protein